MKRYPCALVLLATAVMALTLPSTALAADVYHFRGKTAWAELYSFDPAGCISTSVWLFVAENRYQAAPGAPTNSAWVDLSIYQWNYCTYEFSCSYGSAALPDGAFRATGNLASATLNTTINVEDCFTGPARAVPVALTWTGEGEVTQTHSNTSYHFPGYRYRNRSNGQSRNAQVSGSVTVDGVNLAADASAYGYLTANSGGTVFIEK